MGEAPGPETGTRGIRIATPVSHLFEDPGLAEEAARLSDALELRDTCEAREIRNGLPLLYHCEQSILAPLDLDRVRARTEGPSARGSLKLVSFHADSCYDRPTVKDGMYRPAGRRMAREEMLDRARENAEAVRALLPGDVVLAVENNNRFPTPAYDTVTEAAFLGDLCREAGLRLLLDLPHARITAANSGLFFDSYLDALPLASAPQLHLSGWDTRGTTWVDSHAEPTEEQWADAVSIMRRARGLRWVTLEYYRDGATLLSLLKRLRAEVEKLP